MTALYPIPFVLIVVLLLTRRASVLQAGASGLLLVLLIAYVTLPQETSRLTFMATQTAKGAWLAWQAIAVMLAGLLFHSVVKIARPQLFNLSPETNTAFSYRRLFSVCFFLGPCFESATGFGVGLIITLPFLLRMGIAAPVAVTLALLSQILVPWGALAVGTSVGAELAGLPVKELGVRSALLSAPLLFGYLGVFWWLSHAQGWRVNFMQKLDDFLTMTIST